MTSLSRYEKAMTSLSHSRQKAEGGNRRDSFYIHRRKLVTDKIIPIYQYKTSMYLVKPSEDRKEQKESQFKWAARSPLHQNHDVMDDGIKVVAGSRENVNRLVARKHHTASKHSCSHVKEDDNSYSNCSFIFDTYSINLCLGYQLFIICPLIPLYFSKKLHRYSSIYLPNVWTLPSESCLPFCLVQEYSYLCGQGGDVTYTILL